MAKTPFYSWRDAILASDLPAKTKHVLLTLSCYMNDRGGSCFPSVAQLVADTSLSKPTVLKAIDAARQHGWIKVGIHGFGGQTWRRHEYAMGWPEKVVSEVYHLGDEGGKAVTQRWSNCDPKVVKQLYPDQSIDQSNDQPTCKGPRGGPGYPEWFERLWANYPRRAGNNPKRAAYRAACARGQPEIGEMAAGLERYAQFCRMTDKVGTEHVMRGSTFFGPDQPYRQDWAPPRERKNGVKVIQIDGEAIEVPTRPDPENDSELMDIANRFGINLAGLERRDAIQRIITKLQAIAD